MGGQTINGKTYHDQLLNCQDCDKEFIFTAGEQAFFDTKGFTPPKRCYDCRKRNREDKRRDRGAPRQPR